MFARIKKNIYLVPQSLIEKSLRHGLIKVNKKRVKSSYKLKINEEESWGTKNYTFNLLPIEESQLNDKMNINIRFMY